MSLLRWTSKSTRTIAEELTRLGHPVTWVTVARCLDDLGYSLQANRKTQEGPQQAHRDAPFRYIHRQVKRMLKAGDPVISVDAEKKELVGRFKNAAARGGPRGSHRRSIPEISPAWRKARRFPTGSTTPDKIGRWSMWESPMTQPSLRWKASGAGGNWTGGKPTRGPDIS